MSFGIPCWELFDPWHWLWSIPLLGKYILPHPLCDESFEFPKFFDCKWLANVPWNSPFSLSPLRSQWETNCFAKFYTIREAAGLSGDSRRTYRSPWLESLIIFCANISNHAIQRRANRHVSQLLNHTATYRELDGNFVKKWFSYWLVQVIIRLFESEWKEYQAVYNYEGSNSNESHDTFQQGKISHGEQEPSTGSKYVREFMYSVFYRDVVQPILTILAKELPHGHNNDAWW
jgi:hypothetical protein